MKVYSGAQNLDMCLIRSDVTIFLMLTEHSSGVGDFEGEIVRDETKPCGTPRNQ